MPRVVKGEEDSRQDLRGFFVREALELLDQPLDVVQLEQRFDWGRGNLGRPLMTGRAVAGVFALNPGAIAEHYARDVGGRSGEVDRSSVASPDQTRQPTNVVIVSMRDDHGVEITRLKGEASVRTVGGDPVGIEEAAVKQDAIRANL